MFKKYEKKLIKIEGMSCKHCQKKVEDVLNNISSVVKTKVDLNNKSATIFIKDSISSDEIKQKIEDLGYTVVEISDI